METKAEIVKESLVRIAKMNKGDPVTNICAGEKNPNRLAYFVQLVVKKHKNRYGIVHTDLWAKCTDNHGTFWNTGVEVIYPGHIDYEESSKMFDPIHAVLFA